MTQNNRSRLMNFRVQQCTFGNIQQMKFQRLPLSFLPRNGIKCSPPFLVDHRNAIRLLQCNHDPRSAQCPEDQISLHATTKNSTRFPFLSLFCPCSAHSLLYHNNSISNPCLSIIIPSHAVIKFQGFRCHGFPNIESLQRE